MNPTVFVKSAEIESQTPITVGVSNEELALKFRQQQLAGDGKPEGTSESLRRCADMLETYAPELFPANEKGQVHFARAMMESVADEIKAYLSQSNPPEIPDSCQQTATPPKLPEGLEFTVVSGDAARMLLPDSNRKVNTTKSWVVCLFDARSRHKAQELCDLLNAVFGKEKGGGTCI